MQREHISIPKLIAYVLFSVIIFALQTGTFGGMRIFGSAVDLLPALVTAAALLSGPAEAAVVGTKGTGRAIHEIVRPVLLWNNPVWPVYVQETAISVQKALTQEKD